MFELIILQKLIDREKLGMEVGGDYFYFYFIKRRVNIHKTN